MILPTDSFRRSDKTDLIFPDSRNRAIPAETKLYMALRYLATGSFLLSAADFAGVSVSSASRYVNQVCRAIARLRPRFISFPTTADDCRSVAAHFYTRSRFPRVIGALDCTHVKIQSPGKLDTNPLVPSPTSSVVVGLVNFLNFIMYLQHPL